MPAFNAPGKSQSSWAIEVEGLTALKRALKVLAETDTPFLRAALEEAGQLLRGAASRRAPGVIGRSVAFAGVRQGKYGNIVAVIKTKHPGANPMEFGRVMYYKGYTMRDKQTARGSIYRTKEGRVSTKIKAQAINMAKGYRFRSNPGQSARPFIGIVEGNAAIAEVEERVRALLLDAFEREWERIAAEGDVA